ncbi:MAG: gfo/Idh/MocA family oxidoreductase, partial [Tannerella sp.]|nr:gfo/Idh/MocA family oxidoreductase [Tannerella sp.]
MNKETIAMSRRKFLASTGALTGAAFLSSAPVDIKASETTNAAPPQAVKKIKVALVGTGSRGTGMWGSDLVRSYPEYLTFVGLCDKNEGRVKVGKEMIGADCPTFTDFEKMMRETKPDLLIVTT